MTEIFYGYWWLLFPLGFFIAAGWNSFMRYKRTQAKIDLVKSYAASGKEPPAELLAAIDRDEGSDKDWESDSSKGSGGGNAFLVMLFAGLAAVFAYTGYSGLIDGVGPEFYFIALILGVLALAFLVSGLFSRGRKGD